jgi:hypothetical protein
MRERVCNLLVRLLLGFARAVTLRSKSRRTDGHILLPHLRLPQPGGPVPRIYITQEQGCPVIYPDNGFPFPRLLQLAGVQGRYCMSSLYNSPMNPTEQSLPHSCHAFHSKAINKYFHSNGLGFNLLLSSPLGQP